VGGDGGVADPALLLAATRPDVVRGLVVADASPHGGDAALAFFGGPSLSAEAWADGLEPRDGGWWPRFDIEVMVATLRGRVAAEWRQVLTEFLRALGSAGA
jgi:pimeloyl-ACP methyl ester carboxylesterase